MKMFRNIAWLLLVCLGVTILNSCGGGGDTSTQMGGSIQGTSLSLSRVTSTLAGTVDYSGYTDGSGTSARFNNPCGITTDGEKLLVADSGNNTVRTIE